MSLLVISFIKDLRSETALEVVSNGMSTQIFGTLENILDAVKQHPSQYFARASCGVSYETHYRSFKTGVVTKRNSIVK